MNMTANVVAFDWNLGFNLIGILVGLVSVGWVYASLRIVGGKLALSLKFVLVGILFQMSAFTYTVVFNLLKLFPAPDIDYHHGLMVLGMLCFVAAAKKFADFTK